MVYDFDLDKKTLDLRRETLIAGYSPEDYVCERVHVLADTFVTGTIHSNPFGKSVEVPVTLTRALRTPQRGSQYPILINVYGAYGHNIEPHFRAKYRTLWDHGWTVATAHVRGGGERGPMWHQAGFGENKVRIPNVR